MLEMKTRKYTLSLNKSSYCKNVIPVSHSSLVKNPIFTASRCHAKTNMMIWKRVKQQVKSLKMFKSTRMHAHVTLFTLNRLPQV